MIYLDTAAIVKLVRKERETRDLIDWINEDLSRILVASVLVEIEVPRALRRNAPKVLGAVTTVLAKVHRVEITPDVRATAAAYIDPYLRSLDAIHLATADILVASGKNITAFVTYDKRLFSAAKDAGLPVLAPGSTG